MKKTILILVAVAVVAFAFGSVGYAYAQTNKPGETAFGMGQGMMSGRGGRHGMMSTGELGSGLLHEYMSTAMAAAFDLTTDELTALHNEGKTLWDLAQEQGLTQEEFYAKVSEARAKALEQAVAAGAITQEQADWMQQRMNKRGGMGGDCTGMGHGRRWQPQQTQP